MIISSEQFYQIFQALGLPKNTVEFDISCRLDELVTIRCVYYPDIKTAELKAIVKNYQLIEIAK